MGAITIQKQLAAVEDLLWGKGTTVQSRAGGEYPVTKIRIILPIDDLADLAEIDSAKFPEVYYTTTGVVYKYNGSAYVPNILVGATADRPTNPVDGLQYKDSTLKKTVTWYSDIWYDESGNTA